MTSISRLAPAHKGYEYQDLLVACRFVDVLLGTVVEARCDEKLFDDDRFDDLTTVDLEGSRERVQFKHTDDGDRSVPLESFTTDRRSLRLDLLFRSMLIDRDGSGAGNSPTLYRIVLREQAPSDPRLAAVLAPADGDLRPFVAGMGTAQLRFSAPALWEQRGADGKQAFPFAFLFDEESLSSYEEVEWLCDHLVIEVNAPRASFDLSDPDAAEQLLLTRTRADVGAESFPNADRTAADVAEALVSSARSSRAGLLSPSSEELLRRARLRSDFGAVARAHPVDRAVEVPRRSIVEDLVDAASENAAAGGRLLLVGAPGHGKSWVCQQLLDALEREDWLVAEHYCYLGDADGERLERVLSEAVLGSLLDRLSAKDPRLVTDQRPRFAADEDALSKALHRSLQLEPDRRIALVVDGIDHITRVRARMGRSFDPSRSMAEILAALDLAPGVVLIVLSQPGGHLVGLEEAQARTVTLPGLTRHEIHLLAGRLGLVPPLGEESSEDSAVLVDDESAASFIEILTQRSGGNALYATYLCRETTRSTNASIDPVAVVRGLPPFDGTLMSYYDHLYEALGTEAGWVADIIALADFAVSRGDLREIRPDAAHRVDRALEQLAPVLLERATQGGIRAYHESFARYLREAIQDDVVALRALIKRLTDWLEAKGLLTDARAFHSLLPLLADGGDDDRVLDIVDAQFVVDAVAAGFAASAINANLASAVGAAVRLGRWPVVVRCVELCRAAETYQEERFDDTLVAFADVPAALLGPDVLAERLLHEDRTVMPARAGLQMCAAIDSLGGSPPWHIYMEAYLREAESDNTSYGEVAEQAVNLAWLRGRLRLSASRGDRRASDDPHSHDRQQSLSAPIDWGRLAEWIDDSGTPAPKVLAAVLDTHGWEGVAGLADSLPVPNGICIAIAEILFAQAEPIGRLKSPREYAVAVASYGVPPGSMHRLLALGLEPSDLDPVAVPQERERFLDLTREVQTRSARMDDGPIPGWLDACALTALRDPLGLSASEAIIDGEGWFPCWLRFVLLLARAEASEPEARGSLALEALNILTDDLRPFAGDPRACDLFSLHPIIAETITRALSHLDDDQWRSGLLILSKVSDAISTTMFGELGGPIPRDLVLRLAVEGATPARRDAAEALVHQELEQGSAGRFYSDLAEYRMLAARLALAAGDREEADKFWREACIFLAGYGWHKDITIYEVLDPFPDLIDIDPTAARSRLAELQGLCERVPSHTDLRETRGAWSRWWRLLAKADPVRSVQLAAPQLLAECNDPNWLLNGALEDVWRESHGQVDPLISGALRLTLDTPLDEEDVNQLQRLVASAATPAGQDLFLWLLARADERPVSYSYSNSAEMLAQDDEKIAVINEIAAQADLPSVATLRSPSSQQNDDDRWKKRTEEPALEEVVASFPPGYQGIVKAIRAWHRRPYDARSADWDSERFANILGYRLIELLEGDRFDDALEAVTLLAGGLGLRDRTAVLRSIAEGLERREETRLAAYAYALTWTQTRGHGGWMTLGGQTELDALSKATALDRDAAAAVVGEEIERIIAVSKRGTYGVSQAIIYALIAGALGSSQGSDGEAFEAWDEAFRVISSRAPWVDDSDDPQLPYVAPVEDAGEPAPGDLEGALSLAVLGGLAHPGREKKRRAFLATKLLLEEHPEAVLPGIGSALSKISDPATLAWLLGLLESHGGQNALLSQDIQDARRQLVDSELLVVRALSRRGISGDPPALAPSTPPETLRASGSPSELWKPDENEERQAESPNHDEFLKSVAGVRVRRGERIFSALSVHLRSAVAATLDSNVVEKRLRQQLDTFGDRTNQRWPDAFLAPNQAVEEAFQRVAAGGRAALAMSGQAIADPVDWEDELASAILDNPAVPLTLEASRQPRPPFPPPPGAGDPIWGQIRDRATGGTVEGIEEAFESGGLLLATLALAPISDAPTAHGGPYGDWRWLAVAETRACRHPERSETRDLMARRYRVAEVRNPGDRQALNVPPVGEGDIRLWRAMVESTSADSIPEISQPLVGMDWDMDMVGDGREGLGAPDSLLAPLPSLVDLLGLWPGAPCSFEDDEGVGIALVTWRTEYDVSDYYLAWPRTYGSGIVIRPDLFAALVDAAGEERLVMRDYAAGASRFVHERNP